MRERRPTSSLAPAQNIVTRALLGSDAAMYGARACPMLAEVKR